MSIIRVIPSVARAAPLVMRSRTVSRVNCTASLATRTGSRLFTPRPMFSITNSLGVEMRSLTKSIRHR